MLYIEIYKTISILVILFQFLLLYQCYRITTFSLRLVQKLPQNLPHKAVLICPCKGLETAFEKNMSSLLHQKHPNYRVYFVVEDESDPAYSALQKIIEDNKDTTASEVKLIVAGYAKTNSQKVHNLLTAVNLAPEETELLAFVDSDGYLKEHFLHCLGSQLWRRDRNYAATGYRWFVPEDNKLSTCMLSVLNAPFAGSLGDHRWNSTWGGAMGILKENFYKFNLDKIWQGALSDDYTMTWAVRKHSKGYIFYNPHCLLPSFEKASWKDLISFARRQFIITKRCLSLFWWIALAGSAYYLLCFWGGIAATIYAFNNGNRYPWLYAALPIIVYITGVIRGAARQHTAMSILSQWKEQLKKPAFIDTYLQPIWSGVLLLIILSTAFSKSVVWRNKKYTINSIDETIIESGNK